MYEGQGEVADRGAPGRSPCWRSKGGQTIAHKQLTVNATGGM